VEKRIWRPSTRDFQEMEDEEGNLKASQNKEHLLDLTL